MSSIIAEEGAEPELSVCTSLNLMRRQEIKACPGSKPTNFFSSGWVGVGVGGWGMGGLLASRALEGWAGYVQMIHNGNQILSTLHEF
jgi:hypothetical protein